MNSMKETDIHKLLDEIIDEQQISPYEQKEILINYIKEGEYDINRACGKIINFSEDLKARFLLKSYVLYARYKKIPEFKMLFGGEYIGLQIEYYNQNSELS